MKGQGAAGVPLVGRVRRLEVSPTVAVAQAAAELRRQGTRVLDFTVGEPDQPTPPRVAAAGTAAIEAGRTRYVSSAGLPELRAGVAKRYALDHGVRFAPAEVTITVGAKQGIFAAVTALVDRGDEVVIPTPCWPTFIETVRLAGGKPVLVSTREAEGFKVTARRVARAIGAKTRLVMLNSPCNPTGAVIETDELLAIGRMAKSRGVTLLLDDTYGQLVYVAGGRGWLDTLRGVAGDRLVVVGSASKAYCMTGWRVGWVMGPVALVEACSALSSHSTQGPATFAQWAALEAVTGPQTSLGEQLSEYARRRRAIYPLLTGLPKVSCVEPEGAFYFFPNVSAHLGRGVASSVEFCERLLREKHVALVPGEAFSAPGFVRLSFARPVEELREGVALVAEFLADLQGRGH